jgi:hypothetical protein
LTLFNQIPKKVQYLSNKFTNCNNRVTVTSFSLSTSSLVHLLSLARIFRVIIWQFFFQKRLGEGFKELETFTSELPTCNVFFLKRWLDIFALSPSAHTYTNTHTHTHTHTPLHILTDRKHALTTLSTHTFKHRTHKHTAHKHTDTQTHTLNHKHKNVWKLLYLDFVLLINKRVHIPCSKDPKLSQKNFLIMSL